MMSVYPESLLKLALPSGHVLACHRLGQPEARAWLVLHGGPGSGAASGLWQGFDLETQQVLAPDQRGSGHSRPRGSLRGQRIDTLIDDLERLRQALGLATWSVLGGSWGATLALMYAARHPATVEALVLRGSFRGTRREVIRLLRRFWPLGGPPLAAGNGAATGLSLRCLRPTQADKVLHQLSQLLRNGTVAPRGRRILQAWQTMEQAAALHGARQAWLHAGQTDEGRRLRRHWQSMRPALLQRRREHPNPMPARQTKKLWQKYRIQAHYLANRCGLRPGDWDRALQTVAAQGIATHWIHGRHDAVCPPANSLDSQRRMSALLTQGGPSRLTLTRAGHLGTEPGNLQALRAAVRHG